MSGTSPAMTKKANHFQLVRKSVCCLAQNIFLQLQLLVPLEVVGCCNPVLICRASRKKEISMAFRRGSFALTPPSVIIFGISLVLAVLAMMVHYGHVSVPIINSSRVFDVLAIAYVVLTVGVLFRGV
jgi:hypothetical protein